MRRFDPDPRLHFLETLHKITPLKASLRSVDKVRPECVWWTSKPVDKAADLLTGEVMKPWKSLASAKRGRQSIQCGWRASKISTPVSIKVILKEFEAHLSPVA